VLVWFCSIGISHCSLLSLFSLPADLVFSWFSLRVRVLRASDFLTVPSGTNSPPGPLKAL
jgi:hypothetical protein